MIETKSNMDTLNTDSLTERPGNNENNSSNPSNGACPRMKESQSIWQKATSLRQSLRQSSRVKLGQKSGFEYTPSSDKCSTLGPSSSKSLQTHKEWGSQRNLARERRSLAAVKSSDELASSKRSLHSRSLCMASDWDVESDANNSKQTRSPRKLTKDSGYETSAQCDPDYANSLSDWLSEEKVIGESAVPVRAMQKDARGLKGKDERLEWNIRHRPLSFSHQEVTSECVKNHRQLRHSYSQREVSRHTRQVSVDTLANSSTDLKNPQATTVDPVGAWSGNNPAVTKSTPHLLQGRNPRHSASSSSLLHSEAEDTGENNMVTRRFKKGSVYDALASTSGLDFAPVVQLKAYNSRRDESSQLMQAPKLPEKMWEKTHSSKLQSEDSSIKDCDLPVFTDVPQIKPADATLNTPTCNSPEASSVVKRTSISKSDGSEGAKCLAAHEKYPSWPVVEAESPSVSHRSHSWTGQTDYPKEKVAYSRPKKAHQYKISTNQLQPVLERAPDYNSPNLKSPEALLADAERNHTQESYRVEYTGNGNSSGECNGKKYPARSSSGECNGKKYPARSSSGEVNGQQFDFEGFHTPCIPLCFEDKDYRIHSPPERDGPSSFPSSKAPSEAPTTDTNGFRSRYEDVLRNQAQYSAPLPAWNKQRAAESISEGSTTPDTPFLDRLRLDNGWQLPPPPPVPIPPVAVAPQLQQQQQLQQGNDFELSSENGTWMGSMESSSHGRGIPILQGSYSDLSTLSTQLSNRSSLFDSGHSTMPESGRLSPQSSCDSTAPSLLLEGPTRAQVVARHGCHREIVAHSARVQQPERHGSESILYYATGATRSCQDGRSPSKSVDGAACSSQMSSEDALFRSHASLTLSPSPENKVNKCPSRQNSRKSSNSHSFSSDDSYSRPRGALGDDTSGSSSDVSNITCISNYKGSVKSKRSEKSSPTKDTLKPKPSDQTFPKYKPDQEPMKSKSVDETARKFVFPDTDKRQQRVSDPELKAIQKQAVMSFYQRMSLASESSKSEPKSLIHPPGGDNEPPPPYEASPKLKMPLPKLSLPPKAVVGKQWPPRPIAQVTPKPKLPMKAPEAGLLNAHSKSVPNLVMFKGHNLDLPASHPIFKKPYGSQSAEAVPSNKIQKKRGSPLAKDEVISWDQLPNVLEKKREAIEKAAPSIESKDPPEDNGGCTSGMHYLKPHKSPRKVHLQEVHHSNETASVKVMTPDGVTLVQTSTKGPQKRRPAPPPPPKQPPRRPPPPPPPVTPPPSQVMVMVDEAEGERNKIENSPGHLVSSASSPQLLHGSYVNSSPIGESNGPASPDLPLPPPPSAQGHEMSPSDEPLPPPPDPRDVDVQSRTLDSSSLIYPKNSYMSYRSEKKFGRQGFDGKYHRSFRNSASSMDLTTCDSSFQDGKVFSPNSWEQIHNIRQHGTTVIFHSDCLQGNRLQRSTSQDGVPVEETEHVPDNISNGSFQPPQSNESSDSISAQCVEAQDQQLVPYQPPSHEKVTLEVQNSSPNSHQNSLSTKGLSLKSKCSDDVIINCEMADSPSLDNGNLTDGNSSNFENDADVDLNQNSVKNNKSERDNCRFMNGTNLINRINSATQTTNTPKLYRKCCKSKEELECEQLSKDFTHHYGDNALKNLLVPAPNHKTMIDYLEGLLNLEFEKNGHQDQHTISPRNQSAQKEENCSSNDKCNSSFHSKINDSIEKSETDNQNIDNDIEINKRKEELMLSIGKKVESFKEEQINIRAEINQNELLGQKIANRLQELAKPNEIEKYSLHVEELEKIVNLLLSLSGRLARAENLLKDMPKDCNSEEKKILEAKRDKLREQHEDARRLKESIDRRSNQVSTFLHKYFSEDEYSDYDHFIKMKTKLIVDIRETDEKINLGVEQLAGLSVVAHLWKSANS